MAPVLTCVLRLQLLYRSRVSAGSRSEPATLSYAPHLRRPRPRRAAIVIARDHRRYVWATRARGAWPRPDWGLRSSPNGPSSGGNSVQPNFAGSSGTDPPLDRWGHRHQRLHGGNAYTAATSTVTRRHRGTPPARAHTRWRSFSCVFAASIERVLNRSGSNVWGRERLALCSAAFKGARLSASARF